MKPLIAARIGYYSAFIAAAAIASYGIVQLLQVGGVLTFPADEILIYATSLCIAPPFLLALMSLHHVAPNSKSPWSHAALLFAVMYAVFAIFVYVVQLGVAVPRSVRGDTAGIQLLILTQHSFFWTLDAAVYILMGISTLFASFVFERSGIHRKCKWFLLANALMTPIVAVVYFYPEFSIGLLMMASPWLITATGSMVFLALYFKKIIRMTIEIRVGTRRAATTVSFTHEQLS